MSTSETRTVYAVEAGGLVKKTCALEAMDARWRAAWATHFAVSDGGRVAA